jgi:hypothetical protein
MARGDGPDRDAPEPLSRLLARSEAVSREIERARERLDDLAERYDAEEPLTTPDVGREDEDLSGWVIAPADEAAHDSGETGAEREEQRDPGEPGDSGEAPLAPPRDRLGDVFVVPDPELPDDEPSRDRDITMLQEAARRRLSDER